VYFDRFLIAALLGASAVAYYTVPYDVLIRLWVLPMAVQGVLFPVFASLHEQKSPRIPAVFKRSSETTLLLIAPPAVAGILLAYEGLRLWVGVTFAENSANVARVLAMGVLINSMARTPFTFVQSAGRASWTAMLHLFETPIYLLVLWWLLKAHGIDGAAYAWTARILADTIALYAMAVRLSPEVLRTAVADVAASTAVAVIALLIAGAVVSLWLRAALAIGVSVVCAARLLQMLLAPASASGPPLLGFKG
jgi:O-antigen/teichoic acid export membrane protein